MDLSQRTLGVEHTMLLVYLNAQREHALGILEGLDRVGRRAPDDLGRVDVTGFMTIGLTQARAGSHFQASISSGKFQG